MKNTFKIKMVDELIKEFNNLDMYENYKLIIDKNEEDNKKRIIVLNIQFFKKISLFLEPAKYMIEHVIKNKDIINMNLSFNRNNLTIKKLSDFMKDIENGEIKEEYFKTIEIEDFIKRFGNKEDICEKNIANIVNYKEFNEKRKDYNEEEVIEKLNKAYKYEINEGTNIYNNIIQKLSKKKYKIYTNYKNVIICIHLKSKSIILKNKLLFICLVLNKIGEIEYKIGDDPTLCKDIFLNINNDVFYTEDNVIDVNDDESEYKDFEAFKKELFALYKFFYGIYYITSNNLEQNINLGQEILKTLNTPLAYNYM